MLYASSIPAPVNVISKAGILSSSDNNSGINLPASMTQEQFDAFMSSYEERRNRGSRIGLGGQFGGSRRPSPRITCFNCGLRGHYSDACNNPPISTFEQQRIRDAARYEREQREHEFGYCGTDRTQLPPLTGANTTEVSPRSMIPPQVLESPGGENNRVKAVSCVQSCRVTRRDLGNACVVLVRIPAVRTVFENALAEKRARLDDNDSESGRGPRGTKI
ncbi:hypothetical protein HOY82DRAFT_618235 [Tuber indicum]|nr:hypothetical protein HOY82DRAFT_618235 [Tuber indicum]